MPLLMISSQGSSFRRLLPDRPARVLLARSCCHQGGRGRNRAPLQVQANELNKWANRDGRDEDGGLPDDGFDRDTATVVLRMLTARAVQRSLMHLQELDLFVAQWLNNFAAENPPTEGNKFLLKLFAQPGKAITDPATGATHTIDPQALAHRILQIREDMAKNILGGFGSFVSVENTSVLRTHLSNSYTSGDTEPGYASRRGYHRPRKDPRPRR